MTWDCCIPVVDQGLRCSSTTTTGNRRSFRAGGNQRTFLCIDGGPPLTPAWRPHICPAVSPTQHKLLPKIPGSVLCCVVRRRIVCLGCGLLRSHACLKADQHWRGTTVEREMPPVRGGVGYDGVGGSGIPDGNKGGDAAKAEQVKDVLQDFDRGAKTRKSLPSRPAAASYMVIPIYSSSSNTSAAGSSTTTTAASNNTTFQESTVLGRQELATLWWQHCRNNCQAHLGAKTTTFLKKNRRRRPCTAFCQPLRDNVAMLSRKLIVLQHHRVVIHNECRFPNLVTVVSSRTDHNRQHDPPPTTTNYSDPASSSSTYILSLGDKDQMWMRFCVSVVPQHGDAGTAAAPFSPRNCASAEHAATATTTMGGRVSAWTRKKAVTGPRSSLPIFESAATSTTDNVVPFQKSTVIVSSSPTKPSLMSWSSSSGSPHRPQLLQETNSGDQKLPAVTPTTTGKRQRQNESPGNSQETTTSSSNGSGCKRRLFETQQVDVDEKVVGSMGSNSPPDKPLPVMLRPLRLWPNSNNTLSSSFLSLPMPHDSAGTDVNSSSSCPLEDSQPPVTQFEWAAGDKEDGKNNKRGCCADLTLSDWETMQSKNMGDQGTFCSAMVDLIAFRYADKQGGKKSGGDKDVWIPSLLASAKLNNKRNQKR